MNKEILFVGKFEKNIDRHRRIVLPKYMAYAIHNNEIRMYHYYMRKLHCICIASLEDICDLENIKYESIIRHPEFSLSRKLGSIYPIDISYDGRVRLSEDLLNLADINSRVVIVGSGRHIQIWSAITFNTLARQEDSSDT
jgi:DNA-binding transcriptional regulator/RsmH inhibitor MraZ